ncbi:MAG: NAD(P)H-dependent glycerol-3-phosphate dehydrogenase [Thermoanaerobaculia bacterium]
MMRVGVFGAGSWGTALAIHAASTGASVKLWARRRDLAEQLVGERCNSTYLPGVEFPENVTPTADVAALAGSEIVFVVVPSHGYREVTRLFLQQGGDESSPVIVSATKGIETETLARMSRVTEEEAALAGRSIRFAVLSGPTFAAELAAGCPSAAVIASSHEELASWLVEQLSTSRFRLYSSTDVVGVELAGTAKNVIAIGAGIISGLELGHNTLAALITRGLHEMRRLGVAYGGESRTFAGLAGLGDLVLTCTGGLSRNRRTGMELAAGKSLEEIQQGTSMVAEGVRNSLSITRLAKQKGIEMPISEQMMALIYEGKSPQDTIRELMTRELKSELAL